MPSLLTLLLVSRPLLELPTVNPAFPTGEDCAWLRGGRADAGLPSGAAEGAACER